MRKFKVYLGDREFAVEAESFDRFEDWVLFYADKKTVAMLRLNGGDGVLEVFAK